MATASERFLVDLASEPASWACREVVAKMDWQVETIQPDRMTVKRSFGFLNADNVSIEIVLSDERPDVTAVASQRATVVGDRAMGQENPDELDEHHPERNRGRR